MKRIAIVFMLLSVFVAATAFAGVPGFMKERMGVLEGQLFTESNIPHAKGIVSFFNVKGGPPLLADSAMRVPDMVSRTDESGHFSVKLLPGKYYMGALIREASAGPGPPREGEEYFFAMAEAAKLQVFEVKTKQTSQVGRVTGMKPDKIVDFKDFVVFQGEVLDEQGKPVAGMMVTVKEEMNAPRPKYVSKRTKEDGRFQLKLPPGRYFIMARDSIRVGRPRPGSYIGNYGQASPAAAASQGGEGGLPRGGGGAGVGLQGGGGEAVAIEAQAGQTYDDLTINVYKIPDPEKTRNKYEEEARIRKEDKDVQKKDK